LHQSELRGASAGALLDSFALLSPHLEAQRRSVLFHASLLPFLSQSGVVRGAPRPPRFGGDESAAQDEYFLLSALVAARMQLLGQQIRRSEHENGGGSDTNNDDDAAAVGAAVRCVVQFYIDMYSVVNAATIWRAFGGRMQLPESYSLGDGASSQRHDSLLLLRECQSIVYALDAHEALLTAVWGGRNAALAQSGTAELLSCVARLVQFRKRAALYAAQLAS
jgi:hypothetical protein